jgi:hypothetical protein
MKALKAKVEDAKNGKNTPKEMTEEQRKEIEKLVEDEKCTGVKNDVDLWLSEKVDNHTFAAGERTIEKLKKIIEK